MSKCDKQVCKRTSIGGQAVIEGVMMKGPHKTVLSVRHIQSGEIITEEVPGISLREKYRVLRLPLLRGVVAFVESLVTGYKILMRSADLSGMTELEEQEQAEKQKRQMKLDAADNSAQPKKENGALLGALMAVASVLGVALALVLFMWVPTLIFNGINAAAGGTISGWRALIEGLMKIAIFIGYVALVSWMKDIRRVFMYHGSEHKSIFCYEKGLELTVENVRKQSRFHPRCGTSFMFLMIAVGILFSTIVVLVFPGVATVSYIWVPVKILMIPLFCGLGFELIKLCGRYDNLATRIIAAPGLWVQRLTTKEPEDAMIEVAIASLKAVIPENEEDDRW